MNSKNKELFDKLNTLNARKHFLNQSQLEWFEKLQRWFNAKHWFSEKQGLEIERLYETANRNFAVDAAKNAKEWINGLKGHNDIGDKDNE